MAVQWNFTPMKGVRFAVLKVMTTLVTPLTVVIAEVAVKLAVPAVPVTVTCA
jgi:hypothetical protein